MAERRSGLPLDIGRLPDDLIVESPRHPKEFTQELADELCDRVMDGQSIRRITADPLMPSRRQFIKWIQKNPLFEQQYAAACKIRADTFADDMIDIADDGSRDYMHVDGRLVVDHDHISRSKIRIEARRWHAERMNPRKYGVYERHEITAEVATRNADQLSDSELIAIAGTGRPAPAEPETGTE